MNFDNILKKCGSFGRYQLLVLLAFGLINVLSSMHYFSQTLISFTPAHWCYHKGLADLSYNEIRKIYAQTANPACTLIAEINNGSVIFNKTQQCNKWIFEYESGYESVTTELKWICENAYKSAVGQSFFYIGSVIGTISFGFLADKLGRLPALMCSALSGALGDFVTSFVDSFPAFAASRFLSGVSMDTIFCLMYIIVFEYLGPEKRTFGLNIITTIFYCVGCMLSPWFAIFVGTWRKYLLIASLPALLLLSFPFFICESAIWLITQQKYDRAVKCLKYVAKMNGRVVEESVYEQFVLYYKQKLAEENKLAKTKDSFWAMFRTPRLRFFTIILILKSMVITLAFDIISRNMEGLGTSPFKLFSYTAIVYVPAGLTIIALQNYIGRKGMACSSLAAAGIITTLTGFMIAFLDRDKNQIMLAIMVALGRYGAIVAYESEAQYATEILPTCVRGQAMANIHVFGYAVSFLSAYVIFLGTFYKPLPSIFIGVILFMGAGLCLMLPETLNKKLPETLTDGENFGINEKWYNFASCDYKKDKIITVKT